MHTAVTTFETETKKILDFLHGEFAKLQTGRANAVMIESAQVEAYGQMQPLKTVAGITIEDARTLLVQPWDRGILSNVEKALIQLDLGTTPSNDGVHLRIILPPMTEERRKSLVKTVHTLAEEARISVRNHRHEAKAIIDKEADEDVKFTGLEDLQKKVDEANAHIDASMKKKEDEVMKI
jgi:ribosome recycling factor